MSARPLRGRRGRCGAAASAPDLATKESQSEYCPLANPPKAHVAGAVAYGAVPPRIGSPSRILLNGR